MNHPEHTVLWKYFRENQMHQLFEQHYAHLHGPTIRSDLPESIEILISEGGVATWFLIGSESLDRLASHRCHFAACVYHVKDKGKIKRLLLFQQWKFFFPKNCNGNAASEEKPLPPTQDALR